MFLLSLKREKNRTLRADIAKVSFSIEIKLLEKERTISLFILFNK